ncbi:MAG: helix-turn-helix domain-containing protein [Clostridia bacterium]|nr:helix-turn-helix domain-containing protein [Clostridia bacterium]
MKQFNEILKELRKINRLTQKELAALINATDDQIYFWEKGKSEPCIEDLIKLANIFDVSLDELVGRQ